MVAKRKAILSPVKKLGMILILLVQLFRLLGVGATFYIIFISLIIQGEPAPVFDQGDNSSTADKQNDFWSTKSLTGIIGLTFPAVEVAVCFLVTYLIMGPLSRNISIVHWMKWLLRLRMFWMRMVWATVGIVYAVLLIEQRLAKYQKTFDEKYNDGILVKLGLAFTALEYGCLGVVESVMKVIRVETIEKRLQTHDKGIIGKWKKLCMLSYYLASLAFALRNFSMSLYFGILSAVANSGTDTVDPITGLPMSQPTASEKVQNGLVLVLQIYLALMRGKFYAFFMRNLLSNFLWEVDNETLEQDLQFKLATETKNKENMLETENLVERKHAKKTPEGVASGADLLHHESNRID